MCRRFFAFMAVICCLLVLAGCWDGDGNNSTANNTTPPIEDAFIPLGTAVLEVSAILPKAAQLKKRYSDGQEVAFAIIEANIIIVAEDLTTPVMEVLTISNADNFPKAHGKISVPSSESILRCAVITAKSNYGHEFVSQTECFLAISQARIVCSFAMSPKQSEDADAIVEIAELNWLWLVPETFATISKAMVVAKSGDTVRVNSGTYLENVSMKEGVILEGVNNPVVEYDPETSDGYILFGAIDSQVRGIIFQGGSTWHSGLLLYPGMKVGNNIIKDMPDLAMKIDAINSGEPVEIFNNIVIGGGCCDRGIKLYEGPNGCDVLIHNNTIMDVNEGIIFEMSWETTVGINYRKIWNNIFCGCQWVCYTYCSDELRQFIDLENIFYYNVYYDWGYSGMIEQGPFMEAGNDSSGNYYCHPFLVDNSNVEIDPMLNPDYAPTNHVISRIGEGGVTPGAREYIPANYVNADTINSINSLGNNLISYCWDELPQNVKVGDILQFAYRKGSAQMAEAVVMQHQDGYYYCEVQWVTALPDYTNRQNYAIRVVAI